MNTNPFERINELLSETKATKRDWSCKDIYEYIKGIRNSNVNNDRALDTCIIAEIMFNDNNCY